MTETEYHDAMKTLAGQENRLDPYGHPIPMYGVRHTDNVMKGVQYLADNGGCEWIDRKPSARIVATELGYTAVANCAAMWREAQDAGLVVSRVVNEIGFLFPTEYGFSELQKWEDGDD